MMTAQLVPLHANAEASLEDALRVVDQLRADIVSGKVRAFACVAVCPDDGTLGYIGYTQPISRLRVQGAVATLLHKYIDGAWGG